MDELTGFSASTQDGERGATSVALVNMPFVSVLRPSLQLGLLAPLARQAGAEVQTFHLNLEFAAEIGPTLYELLCQHRGRQLGDWIFSRAAFGLGEDAEAFLDLLGQDLLSSIGSAVGGEPRQALRVLRDECAPEFLDRMLTAVPWADFDVVGFTSTFQQNVASLGLARRVKQIAPSTLTLFGGANFEAPMGQRLMTEFDWIDLAIIGEADEAFPDLLRVLAQGGDPAQVPGVCTRGAGRSPAALPGTPFDRLDDLPAPDYDEYFTRAERLELLSVSGGRRDVDLPFESSRGCWWGAKHHCVFCGLNGATIGFRRKSEQHVLAELAELSRRYRSFRFEAVDNIMDVRHLRDLVPALAAADSTYRFFYEIKSNLKRAQLRDLAESGVVRIQPGIESLSSRVLQIMRKGVSAAQNVNTLRWAAHYGIDVSWNLLYGFPGERPEDYETQVALARDLRHLRPPEGVGRIWLERFSPLFTECSAFGVRAVRPEASYGFVYPPGTDLAEIAYFFDYEMDGALPDPTYAPLASEVEDWRKAWSCPERPTLDCWISPGVVVIEDARIPDMAGTHVFEPPLRDLYLACSDRPVGIDALVGSAITGWGAGQVRDALDEFCARGLMMRDRGSYLALAVPVRAS